MIVAGKLDLPELEGCYMKGSEKEKKVRCEKKCVLLTRRAINLIFAINVIFAYDL
jgi:hypothetical protein